MNAERKDSFVAENHVDPLANLCPDDRPQVPHPLGPGDGGGEAPICVLDIHGFAVNLSNAIISLLAENWRVRGFLHGHTVEKIVVGGQVIPFNLLSCKQRNEGVGSKEKEKNKSN